MKKYFIEKLDIGWEPEKCIHSAVCVNELSSVFDPKNKPWIDVNGASEEKIAAQIDKCPSGALSYSIKGEQKEPESKPVVAGNSPTLIELEKDKNYAWCSCGKSDKQPFCDGSHKGAGMAPNVFKLEDTKTVALCLCKQTSNPPYCDGSHSNL
jgi:uncharacterized Fe-S cluster protein YjdI/CDGSH-type Zn-finger protein|tara:strand:- start:29 stop:487 length:459 start_codon:yes stop_codon:yes gene_type:complete